MCKTKDDLSIIASVATTATELTERNQAIRDHIDGCAECQELAERQRKAARRVAEFLQYRDGEAKS